MIRRIYSVCLCLLFLSTTHTIWAQDDGQRFIKQDNTKQEGGYTIAGSISFENTGNVYIYVVTEQIFSTPFTGIQKKIIAICQEDIKQGKISFRFDGIQPGIYGIRCFQDVNGNGKLDRGMFGPKEPWGMSWQGEKPAKCPSFKDISFDVTADITNMIIDVK